MQHRAASSHGAAFLFGAILARFGPRWRDTGDAMTDEADDELGELEFAPECEVMLHDGSCWVLDPSYLDPDTEVEGVLALQYTADAGLWYLDGASRQWVKVGERKPGKPTLKTVQ